MNFGGLKSTIQKRKRSCSRPFPSCNGKYCSGKPEEIRGKQLQIIYDEIIPKYQVQQDTVNALYSQCIIILLFVLYNTNNKYKYLFFALFIHNTNKK